MDRKLLDYLPAVVRGYAEYQAIMTAEQPEIEKAWAATDQLLADQFVATASEIWLVRWEKILGLTPKGSETLEERRFRVLFHLSEGLPYSMAKLSQLLADLLKEYCDETTFSIEARDYRLIVGIGINARPAYAAVWDMLERVVPRNMLIELSLLYKTWGSVLGKTWGQAKGRTWAQMREKDWPKE